MRTERQAHGFIFEEYVEKHYGVNREGKTYTDKWDGELNGKPVSIKHIKKGNAVDLGDIFRQASINEDFYMIIDFYSESDDEIYVLDIPAEEWKKYFPTVPFEEKFRSALSSVTNNREDDMKWKTLMNECKNFWKQNCPNIIRPNGKRDHQTQKRWQCSICNSLFYKEFIPKYQIEMEEIDG